MKVTPDLRVVKPVPGNRYMINPKRAGKDGAPIFPYNELMMEQNKDLVEWFPNFVQKEAEPELNSGTFEEPIEIEDVPIVVENTEIVVENTTEEPVSITETKEPEPRKKFTPIELARLAKEAKKAAREKVG